MLSQKRAHPLDGAFERVQRAREHLTELERAIEAFRQTQEKAAFKKLDPNTGQTVGFELNPLPLRFSILVGEVCYNCRSALDYLVFELSTLDSGVVHDCTQFIIEDSPKRFRNQKKRGRLGGINKRHIAMLKLLQPYNGCDWTWPLKTISNPDKHRQLVATIPTAFGIGTVFGPRESLRPEHGTIISAATPRGGEMHMQRHLTLTIQLPEGTNVIQTLDKIQAEVTKVLTDFKPEF